MGNNVATQGILLDYKLISEKKLLEIYNNALDLVLQGTTYMEYTGEGSNFKSVFSIPVAQMLSEARYALKQKNPQAYGHLITEVRPFFI